MDKKLDLSGVVRAVKSASDKELAVLSDISRKLDRNEKSSYSNRQQEKKAQAKKHKPTPVVERVVEKTVETNRSGEVELFLTVDDVAVNTQEIEVTKAEEINTPATVSSIADELSATESEQESSQGNDGPHDAPDVIVKPIVDIPPTDPPIVHVTQEQDETAKPVSVSLEAPESIATASQSVQVVNDSVDIESAITNAMDEFKGYWHDANGKLRRADGRYASKAETSSYKNAQQVADERAKENSKDNDDKKGTGLFKSVKDLLVDRAKSVLTREESNDASDAAGAAAGGSFFYAAKGIYEFGQETKELIDNAKEKAESSGLTGRIAQTKVGKLLGIGKKKDDEKASELARSTDTVSANENESSTSASASITSTKQESFQSNTLEVLRESTQEREDQIDDVLDKLDEVKEAFKNISTNGGGGLMDLAGDWMRRDRGGRGGGRKGGKLGRVGSVLSSAGEKAGSVASKGASLFKGAAKLGASGLGRAIPFLAPVLTAYEAVNGFTDTEKQKEIFNLKEGQEATTGQKAATALGNVLDLGGLVSGGAGLLGSALGFLGFDGAKEALTFDSGDMAKGIYDAFTGGSESDKESSKDESNVQSKEQSSIYEKNAIEYQRALEQSVQTGIVGEQARETMHQMDKGNGISVTDKEISQYAETNGVSRQQAEVALSEQKKLQAFERMSTATQMGVDISGMTQTTEHGKLYSPQLRADQLAKVDAEIERQKQVNAIASNGDFRNERFISSEHKSYMDSLSQKVTEGQQSTVNPIDPATQDLVNAGLIDAPESFSLLRPNHDTSSSVATATSQISSNNRVSEILANKELRESSEKSNVIKLDKESIDAIGRAASGSTTNVNINGKAKSSSRGGSDRAAPASPAKSTGSIPNNFNDLSLQRQAADME